MYKWQANQTSYINLGYFIYTVSYPLHNSRHIHADWCGCTHSNTHSTQTYTQKQELSFSQSSLFSEREYLSFWNVLETTWAAGLLLCSRRWPLTSTERSESVKLSHSLIGRIARVNTRTHGHSLPRRHSYIHLCVFIRSGAVWSSGAREGAGWRWRGWRAVLPWRWLWRRSRSGAEGESQEPQLESCWSDSTCSPASSLHHCLLSEHKHRKRGNCHTDVLQATVWNYSYRLKGKHEYVSGET